jgi:hypothetical protein
MGKDRRTALRCEKALRIGFVKVTAQIGVVSSAGPATKLDPELIKYVANRLRKLRPSKKEALFNSIGAMFQFQGGISDGDKETRPDGTNPLFS